MRLARPAACRGRLLAALALHRPPAPPTNDPLSAKQWGPEQIHAEQAWATSTGAGAVIAVVDTGVDLTHPDLAGQARRRRHLHRLQTPRAATATGRARTASARPSDAHGTHVSGIAAAATNNGIGIAGVAPDAKIMPVKVLEDGSGSFEDIAQRRPVGGRPRRRRHQHEPRRMQGTQVLTLTGLETTLQDAITYARGQGRRDHRRCRQRQRPAVQRARLRRRRALRRRDGQPRAARRLQQRPPPPDLMTVAAPGGSSVPDLRRGHRLHGAGRHERSGATCGYGNGYDEYAGTPRWRPRTWPEWPHCSPRRAARRRDLRGALTTTRVPPEPSPRRVHPGLRLRHRRRRSGRRALPAGAEVVTRPAGPSAGASQDDAAASGCSRPALVASERGVSRRRPQPRRRGAGRPA